jgi:hypothetical protein
VKPIETRVAHTGTEELRFHGRRVFAELLGRTSLGQMLVLGISGRLLSEDEIGIIDDLITVMTSADPRLWPFKLTRLAASYGTAAYGVAVTLIGSEGGMYGTNRLATAARWLVDLERRTNTTSPTDEALLAILDEGGDAAAGFGVLYRARDERFTALVKRLVERERNDMPFTRVCLQVARVARERRQLEAHVSLAVAAVCLDVGMSVEAVAGFWALILAHCALANAVEGASQAPAVLRELPLESVSYRGAGPRTSPRKLARTEHG